MSETAEVDIANIAKNAIVHGIDTVGAVVAAGGTPSYGGTGTGEAFMAQDASGDEAFNVYSFQGEDDPNTFSAPITPCVIVVLEGHTPSAIVYNKIVTALTITWWIQIGMFDGWVTTGGTQYKESKAMFIWRNRLVKVIKNLSYSGVSILEEGDTEPFGVSKSDGEADAGDNTIWVSGASKYIEYVEDIS